MYIQVKSGGKFLAWLTSLERLSKSNLKFFIKTYSKANFKRPVWPITILAAPAQVIRSNLVRPELVCNQE